MGNELVKNLVANTFAGSIFPINPKGGQLYGLKVRASLRQVRARIDLAIIAVPAKIVPQILEECGAKKIKAAVIISAGFKEVGNLELEQQVAAVATKHGITLIGPNCLGLLNPEIKLNASFASIMPPVGEIAFMSQSGAICASILDYAVERELGFSKFISIGNKAQTTELELLEYFYRDPRTKVILAYVEQLADAKQLVRLAKQMVLKHRPKPVIVLKSGRTAAGAKASASHTGALAGSDAAYEALFLQAGMIRADSIAELFDLAEVFTRNALPKDCRVAIITNAGGPGVLSADALIEADLCLAELSEYTQEMLRGFLPPAASIKNPIDILGDASAERYHQTVKTVLADPQIDAVQIILTPQSMTEVTATAKAIVAARLKSKKPVVVTFMGQSHVEKGVRLLHEGRVATTWFPEAASHALSALQEWRQWIDAAREPTLTTTEGLVLTKTFRFTDFHTMTIDRVLEQAEPGTWLPANQAHRLLVAAGLPLVPHRVVATSHDAQRLAKKWDQPVVLKIVSPDIVHKTDVGGVMLNVLPDQVGAAYTQLLEQVHAKQPTAHLAGVEVMPFVEAGGREILIGLTTDPQLGATLGVGQGGIYAEAVKDMAWGLVPITPLDAYHMIHRLQIADILYGWRGQPAFDLAVLIECLGRISSLVNRFPQISEIDLNPVMLRNDGQPSLILDARVKLR